MTIAADEAPALPHGTAAQEIWKDIPSFPDYQASSLGQIRSRKLGSWKTLRATPHSNTGYLIVSLRRDGKYVARGVHQLVAATFVGPALGRDVNHISGNKRDNCLANLEYLSRGDNHRHAYRTGLRRPVGLKLSSDDVRAIQQLRGTLTYWAIGRRFGVCAATVSRILNRQRQVAA